MSLSRTITIDKWISYEDIKPVLDKFFNFDYRFEINKRIYITLPGKCSSVFRLGGRDNEERWIEIWTSNLNSGGAEISIITREMDEFTNCIAAELERILTIVFVHNIPIYHD